MDNNLQTQSLPPIIDNRITLFYFFKEHVSLTGWNHAAQKKGGLPETITNPINTRLNTEPLWKEQKKYNISQDLNQTIKNLFHADEKKAICTWQIDKMVLKLLSGIRVRHLNDANSDLVLKLNASAQHRLTSGGETATAPNIELENIVCHYFETGFTIAVVELKISNQNLSHGLLNEAVYSLARFNELGWREAPGQTRYCISLGELVRSLVNGEKSKKIGRTYTHTMIQVKGTVQKEDFTRCLAKLARHFNDEYSISGENGSVEIIRDYENITHCLSHEGASCGIILSDKSPEYLADYKNKVIRPTHIPIHLLAYHAEHAMQQYAISSTYWLYKEDDEEKVETRKDENSKPVLLGELDQIKLQLLNFELNFFQPVISNIGGHNRLHQGLIKVKCLEEQHAKITSNNKILSGLVRDKIKEIETKANNEANLEYCKIAAFGVATVGFLSTYAFFKEISEAILKAMDETSKLAEFFHHYFGLIDVGISLGIAIYILTKARQHCSQAAEHQSHGPAHLSEEVIHILHLLGNKPPK